jgi:branched-chain amino acid transport system ATP-binding protein
VSVVLQASQLCAGYDGHPVVEDLDIDVNAGEVVGLLGANGAGKTTTLLTLSGDLPAISGSVSLHGTETRAPLHRRAAAGMSFVTEERSVFMRLSVADNLKLADCDPARAFALFPELEPLRASTVGLLSGGEQQMLTLARALTRDAKVLLADELSLGLAPLVVKRLLAAVRDAAKEGGMGVLLVEQHVKQMLRVADRVFVMSHGRIVTSGTAAEVGSELETIERSYLATDTTRIREALTNVAPA